MMFELTKLPHALSLSASCLLLGLSTADIADAQASDQNSELTQRALAAFGFVALPNETASTLNYQVASGDNFDFQTTQFGGGFRPVPDGRIYLEGFLGWQIYDPALLRDLNPETRGTDDGALAEETRWSSRAATGAIGYNFDVTERLTLRPAVHLAIGEVSSNDSLSPDLSVNGIESFGNGDLTTGAYGASFGLEYKERSRPKEVDIRARYTWMRIVPLENDPVINTEADAMALAAYTRLRHPLGSVEVFDRPLRAVWEASASAYPGDQGQSLDTPWLAQFGAGLEVETSALAIPYLDRVRLIARYAFGESYNGYSIGLGISFRRTR